MNALPVSTHKNEVSLVAAVARDTGRIVAAEVTTARDLATLQPIADTLPPASTSCTAAASVDAEVMGPNAGQQRVWLEQEATQRIERLNANFRTSVGRLARASRCCSRALHPYAPQCASVWPPILPANASYTSILSTQMLLPCSFSHSQTRTRHAPESS